jgi:molybdopterin/thiamine biosynthesis adenylyltransferase
MTPRQHVVVVGAGGNIGSHLVPHLARMPELGRLTLVDRDRYESRNVANQDVLPGAAGRGKAAVQAARARRANPHIEVRALAEDVEQLPLGLLRGDLILACLDNRRARQRVNDAAARLGVPWLDAGVLGDGLLARVTRYAPGDALPCLECAWDDADYAAVEQSYPCESAAPAPAPPRTTAPSSLGALAAAFLALECRKLLSGSGDPLPPGSELVVDAAHRRHFVTTLRRNPRCRRADHGVWTLEPLPAGRDTSLGELFESVRARLGANGDLGLRIEGKRFARQLRCESCGATRRVLRLAGRLRRGELRCSCGAPRGTPGFGLVERLQAADLTRAERGRRLSALGLRLGEVLSVGSAERELHLELVAP